MAQANSLTGTIEVGDTVETLSRKRTVTGEVTHIDKRGIARIFGTHYDGGPTVRCSAHVENLALVKKGGQGGAAHAGDG